MEVEIDAAEPTDDGADRVVFLLAPNPGEQARPLARAASGGELSPCDARGSASCSPRRLPTLVFDEVDAGIGGEAGIAVGRSARLRSARVTRCCASRTCRRSRRSPTLRWSWRRRGDVADPRQRRTHVAHAAVVDGADRVAELSRMLAGVGASSHARKHAEELLAPRVRSTAASVAERKKPPPWLNGRAGSRDGVPAEVASRTVANSVEGTAKVDARTKDMIRRLQPGDIAVIDHTDLDRVAADGLIESGVVAVINAGRSISGRYPNVGPIRVVRAGILLVDDAGPDLLDVDQGGRPAQHRRRGDLPRRRGGRERHGPHRARDRGQRWRSPAPRSASSSSDSRRTRSSTSGGRRSSPSSRSSCRRCTPCSRVVMRSSWCAATTTRATSPRCVPTSASTARRSSASTAAPTRSSTSA